VPGAISSACAELSVQEGRGSEWPGRAEPYPDVVLPVVSLLELLRCIGKSLQSKQERRSEHEESKRSWVWPTSTQDSGCHPSTCHPSVWGPPGPCHPSAEQGRRRDGGQRSGRTSQARAASVSLLVPTLPGAPRCPQRHCCHLTSARAEPWWLGSCGSRAGSPSQHRARAEPLCRWPPCSLQGKPFGNALKNPLKCPGAGAQLWSPRLTPPHACAPLHPAAHPGPSAQWHRARLQPTIAPGELVSGTGTSYAPQPLCLLLLPAAGAPGLSCLARSHPRLGQAQPSPTKAHEASKMTKVSPHDGSGGSRLYGQAAARAGQPEEPELARSRTG